MPANYYMPGNVVNPSNDPIVNERLRGLLAAGVDDVRTPGAGANFGKGLLSGVLGLPGDVMSLMSEIPARLPGPQQGAAEQIRGLLGNITSDGLAERMGADLSRPVTQAGLIGAPDPKDIGKGLVAAASGVPVISRTGRLLSDYKPPDGVNVSLYKKDYMEEPVYELNELVVSEQMRGKGVGSKAMQDMTSMADEEGATIVLNADSSVSGLKGSKAKDKKLIEFYKKHGFVTNSGRNKDFRFGGPTQKNSMYRYPRAEK